MRKQFCSAVKHIRRPKAEMDSKTYKISATLFSNRLRHSVVVVAMSYSGPNIDLAMKEFIEKLRSNIPNVACTGWNLDAHIDVGSIPNCRINKCRNLSASEITSGGVVPIGFQRRQARRLTASASLACGIGAQVLHNDT